MSTTRLVHLLRKAQELETQKPSVLYGQAADRIEQLEAALQEITHIWDENEYDRWRVDIVHRAQRALEDKA